MSFNETAFKALSDAVRLDKDDLDTQLIEHGEMVRQVGDHLALCTAERDAAKRALEELEAAEAVRVRDETAAAGGKITEAAIKECVLLDRRVILAKDKLAGLTLAVTRWGKLEDAYTERRHAFSKLSDLYGNQYWSGQAKGPTRKDTDEQRLARRERLMQTRRNRSE